VPKKARFIIPSAPVLMSAPPSGGGWLHEVKFDGWRAQLHKLGDEVVIFTRTGVDYTARFPAIRDSMLSLPVRSAIIDAEIVICDGDGKPDFKALMDGADGHLCAWCFDLLELNGYRERRRALIERKAMLRRLLIKADDHALRYSDEFANAEKLLAVATKQGLEGIVSKKATQQYVSGKNVGWIKVKTATWRAANKDRWEMFQRERFG
jgi:bifunctional non-homologous end joining protein LigD